jgi:RimJ/RimL family protein N-acetyltransferase
MDFSIQPQLENDLAKLIPLKETDFEELYKVASDPKVWEQHPNKNRYEREAFQNFFEGAMESGGGFLIWDKRTHELAGSTRFYGYEESDNSIHIGYTFYGTKFWGTGINPSVKKMMMDYIFQYVDNVLFHVGSENFRSRTAMYRLGAELIEEKDVAYYGEPTRRNAVYRITKKDYLKS